MFLSSKINYRSPLPPFSCPPPYREVLVHGEGLTAPVHGGPNAAKLVADAAAILVNPLPHLCQEVVTAWGGSEG